MQIKQKRELKIETRLVAWRGYFYAASFYQVTAKPLFPENTSSICTDLGQQTHVPPIIPSSPLD